jgi:serine/threonine protein kinase
LDGRDRSLKDIFSEAVERPPAGRAAFLDEACAGNAELRLRVERLLAALDTPRDFLEKPPATELSTEELADVPEPAGLVGQHVSQYHLRRVIAAGGMGTVYEATQEHPRRTVAVKVLNPGIASRSALRRFEHESQILARLSHPNIAQVFEAGTHGAGDAAVPYFVMEYIPGARSITEYARHHGLGSRRCLELFAKVCDAVHHGHSRGIVHRDLKPGNILVDADGEPKVIDFGVARATDFEAAMTTVQTDVGQLIGTLQYMSPEQVEADPGAIDQRSDVYSLGVVLYELLSGRPPYDLAGAAVIEAARIIREKPPARLSTLDTRLRGDVETIVLTALAKERLRRYQSAEGLGRDIERYLADEPITARGPSMAYLLGRSSRVLARRHPVGAMAAVAVLAVLVAEFIGVPLVHHWTGGGQLYKRLVASVPWPGGAGTWDSVRVIRFTDDTVARGRELGAACGVEGIDPANRQSFRALHGRLMQRLAESGARCVTWDVNFRKPGAFDEAFAEGARALRAAGIDVIVSVPEWTLGPEPQPEISDRIRDSVRIGCPTMYFEHGRAHWSVHLFAQRGNGDPQPSLSLATYASCQHPGRDVAMAYDDRDNVLRLRFYDAAGHPGGAGGTPRPLAGAGEIALSTFEPYSADPRFGLQAGDMIGVFIIDIPGDAALEAASIDYAWVLQAPGAELRRRFGGRAVLIGQFTAEVETRPYPDGRTLHPEYGHAAAIDMLLGRRTVKVARAGFALAALLAAALLGIGVALLAAGCWRRHVLLLAGAAMLFVVAGICGYRGLDYLCNPLPALLALLVAAGLGSAVNRARLARASMGEGR